MSPPAPHDDDRCARLYEVCKAACVAFARRLLAASYGRNRYLCAFDAEEFYDTAWETYYDRREYLEDRDDHVARLNALILSRVRDERRRSGAQKRGALSRAGGLDGLHDSDESAPADSAVATTGIDTRVADRDEIRWLLAQVRNPDDTRALLDHEVQGLTFEEIGAREGISAEAARRRALRAKQQARARRGTDE